MKRSPTRSALPALALLTALVILIPITVGTSFAMDRPTMDQKTMTSTDSLLHGLRQEHPRLFLTPKRLQTIQSQAKSDPVLAQMIDQTKRSAEKMLGEPVTSYKIPDGKRLLGQSRYAIQRIWTMSLAYRLTKDRRFLDAVVKEMHTIARFKDWNPPHFLDTAEMTAAMAVGYDWLHDVMDPKDRQTFREAILRLGMQPGFAVFQKNNWWVTGNNNWNQVCNGGLLLGALAIADEEPQQAQRMIHFCLKSIPHALKSYRPDGAYPEGPGYWVYGTSYTVLTILALDSALGHDFDIHQSPALDRTAAYRVQIEGPSGKYFNYADGNDGASPNFATLGLAFIYKQPAIARFYVQSFLDHYRLGSKKTRRPKERFFALNVIYYPEIAKRLLSQKPQPFPLDAKFRGIQDVVTMRGDWGDPNATFLAIKGGNNQANHGHLDIGSFVLDADGVRWAVDLGTDNYNMPGYFDRWKRRWTYYRMTNLSHNTLVIGDQLQNIQAVARVTDFRSAPKMAQATIDMSDAYESQAASVVRKASLPDRKRVVIRDTITAPKDAVRWGMVTRAKIELDGSKAVLRQNGKTMRVEILSPAGAKFEVLSTKPPTEKENPNQGTRMLAFTAKPNGSKPLTLEVTFTPEE